MLKYIKYITYYYSKIEKLLSSMKFAVFIIILFTISLTIGTFVESYNGRDFANRLIYKSWWFMAIQGLMFLSILLATLVRLPAKKRLYGFYTIHAGLILLFIGSFITYINGVDGIVELRPSEPTNKISITDSDVLAIRTSSGKVIRYPLPYNAYPLELNEDIEGFKIGTYRPFSELKTKWIEFDNGDIEHSSSYFLYNDNVSESFTLSLAENADFKSNLKLGPLSISYMPKALLNCFANQNSSGFILWNIDNNECQSISKNTHKIGKTNTGNVFFVHQWNDEYLKFFPNVSPLPINDDLSKNDKTPFRVFAKKIFEDKPNLFLFGLGLSYYSKRKGDWVIKKFNEHNSEHKLPWMDFKIRLTEHREDSYPIKEPIYTKPIFDKGQLIKGDLRAIQVDFFGEKHWVRDDQPLNLSDGSRNIQMMIVQKEYRLPYQLTLEKFKMDTNPGTNDPASYESFVSLLDGRSHTGSQSHHIYMNNPLKYDDFTFYQSSYFQLDENTFGSALSVNYDPGRFLKYFGSFLIVFGSIWHFLIKRRKKNTLSIGGI